MKYFLAKAARYFYIFFVFACACSQSKHNQKQVVDTSPKMGTNSSFAKNPVVSKLVIPDKNLSPPEYLSWVKELRGITYDTKENAETQMSILYKPLALEAALSLSPTELTAGNLKKAIKAKEGFQYLIFEFWDKIPSATETSSIRKKKMEQIKASLLFIENGKDTLERPIIESFSPALLNQPYTFLILIPDSENLKILEAYFKGAAFNIGDLAIRVSKEQLKKFPEIKLKQSDAGNN